MFSKVKKTARAIVVAGLGSIAVSGCTVDSMDLGVASAEVRNVAFNDNCARFRKPFLEIRAQRDKIIGDNVAAGIVTGAIAGLLIGGDIEDAVAGAVVGGLAGAAAAYAQNAASRGATEASLARFANSDARKEAAQNDRLVRNIVSMNACRLDQADSIVARAKARKISPDQARILLNRVKLETRNDNRAIERVAGFTKSYNAYVGVLSRKDVAAAQRTKKAVASYKPKVNRVKRTRKGRAAIAPRPVSKAPTSIAKAENSRKLIKTSAVEHRATVDAAVESKLDDLLEFREI